MRKITDDLPKPDGSAFPVRQARALVGALDTAERELLASIVAGQSLIMAAGLLGLSLENTVRLKAKLMRKLGASQTADLVRVGLYAGCDEVH